MGRTGERRGLMLGKVSGYVSVCGTYYVSGGGSLGREVVQGIVERVVERAGRQIWR